MAEKSKILIIGGTGYIGKFVVEASAKSGHPTFALVRESTVSDPVKGKLIEGFKNSGVTLVHGDLHNHESLVKAIKQVDVVISTVGSMQLADQTKIIAAIKEAGNIKRFLPSEFGNDVDRLHVVEPAKSTFAVKVQIRRTIEAEGIPYTYVSSNYFAGYFLPTLAQPGVFAPPPPRDKAIIPGDGNPKDDLEDEEVGNSLISVIRRILAVPKTKKEDWRRTSIFQMLVNCGNQARKLIIDGGSSVNAVSATTVERLKLPIQPHPHPYKVAWIDNTSIRVTQCCLVSFSYGSYNDSIWCDVIPMNVTHILLGRPWLYDRDVQHSGKKNTYAFSFKNKEIVLKPMTTDAMGKIKEQLSLKEQLSQLVLIMTTDVKYTTGEEYLSQFV